jgi:predicted nucleic acid-binding protein
VTLIDTNVLLDILSNDPNWRPWSIDRMEECSSEGPLWINDVIYAELSARFSTQEALDDKISALNVARLEIPKPALFLAGQAYERYRRAGGTRSGVLPDFFIGAHAHVAQLPLLTRDVRRYRTYFPDVELISPESRDGEPR